MGRRAGAVLIFGCLATTLGIAMYPIYYHPKAHLQQYKKEQAVNRAAVVQEDVQPPGLKVWSDPFSRK